MTSDNSGPLPVWTLATEDVRVPSIMGDEDLTPARLSELRTALAALVTSPITTLEAHPITANRDRESGLLLHAASPLAQQLAQLITQTVKSGPSEVPVSTAGDVLYRMVVPAKVAAEVGKGLVQPMASKAAAGGIHSALVNSTGIAAQATFVPVAGKAAVAGAVTGSAATAGVAAGTAGAVTVAAPLVLMAVAVSVSAHADHQRRESINRITDLLEQLHDDKLEDERSGLDGCRDAIDKATSILLDQGRVGPSLGLDSAVHAIGASVERTRRRLRKWQDALNGLPDGPVEIGLLAQAFPGIDKDGGTFRAHLELARLAIALKRRVLVLQAVEHAQLDGANNPFQTFMRVLQDDERRVDELDSGIRSVLLRLSTLEVKRPGGFRSVMFTPREVDTLLRTAYRLRALGEDVYRGARSVDVAIEIERRSDGSLVVFPAVEA